MSFSFTIFLHIKSLSSCFSRLFIGFFNEKIINPEILEYAKASGKPMLDYIDDENYYIAYNEFYDKIIGED